MQSSQSTSSKAQKNLRSFNFPSSLLTLYSAGSFDVHSTKCSFPSLHRVKPKRIFAPSTFLPLSLTVTVQGFYMCVPPNTELALAALRFLRSTHSVPFFPFGGEWRLRSKRNLESTLYQSEIPWCEHETQPVHLLINRRRSERRRNLRILSKWKLRMKSTHPSQSRPPYTFTYVKKEYKNILTGFYSHHHSD